MAIPLTRQEADKAGLKPASATDVSASKALAGGISFSPNVKDYLCYTGPCSNGWRTICYYTDTGCDDCRQTQEGC